MADILQTSALIIVAQNYRDDIIRQINRTATALKLFPITEGEGQNLAWVAEGDGMVAESYAEGADATNFGSDTQASATIPWARYRGNFHVSGTAMAVAASSRTPEGNIRLWARNMLNAVEKVSKQIDTDFYVGTGAGGSLVGLDAAIGSTTNTYAGIDRSLGANAFFRPTVVDAAGAVLTFAQIRSDLSSIKVASGYRPDVALVSPNTYNKVAALYDPQKQYAYQVVDKVYLQGRDAVLLEGGAGGLTFDGCYFIEDSFTPDNTIYYLNSMYVRLEYLPIAMSNLGGDEVAMLEMNDGMNEPIPMGMMMEILAKTGDSEKAQLKVYPQLGIVRPNSCGVRKNIG